MPKDKGGPAWSFDARARGSGYRGPDGRFISAKQAAGFRDEFIDKQKLRVDGLTDKLVDGKINIQQWELETRKIIKDTYGVEYAAAKGGVKNVTSAEWGALGPKLRDEQYTKLHVFAQDIADGKLSPAQINARSKLYVEGASQVFEQGKAENKGIDTSALPAYPGDGQTQCRSNCRCNWDIQETEDAWEATWQLNDAEHCDDCLANAEQYNPLRIPK